MLVSKNNGNSRDPKIVEDPEYLMMFEDPECFEDPGPNKNYIDTYSLRKSDQLPMCILYYEVL